MSRMDGSQVNTNNSAYFGRQVPRGSGAKQAEDQSNRLKTDAHKLEFRRLAGVSNQSGYSIDKLRDIERKVGSKVTSARTYGSGRSKITIIRHEKRSDASIANRDRSRVIRQNGTGVKVAVN